MKSKQFVAAILAILANADLDDTQRRTEIDGLAAQLAQKCDDMIRSDAFSFESFDHNHRRADVCVLAADPWLAVMHGLKNHDVDPASLGLFEGGFMRLKIEEYLHEQRVAASKLTETQRFFALSIALRRVEGFMSRHGWAMAIDHDPVIKNVIYALRLDILHEIQPIVTDANNIASEAIEIAESDRCLWSKPRNRFIGVQRHLKNNRENLVRMFGFVENYFDGEQVAQTFTARMGRVIAIRLPDVPKKDDTNQASEAA